MSKVLIVVDMQRDFVDGALGTEEARAIVPHVLMKVNQYRNSHDILFTLDTHDTNYLETQEGKNLPVEHCIYETPGWRLIELLEDEAEDRPGACALKDTFGAAHLVTMLADMDSKEPIEEIELIGLCTDICVISNALLIKAFFPEVPIIVDAAGCAGVTPESHKIALEVMKVCQVKIINEDK